MLYAGYYVAELLNEFTDDADPHPDLFDAADETLQPARADDRTRGCAGLAFEMTALRILGHQPALAHCRNVAGKSGQAPVSFGQLAGGVCCTVQAGQATCGIGLASGHRSTRGSGTGTTSVGRTWLWIDERWASFAAS